MPSGPFTKIMVLGPPGSGKSTLARQLGGALSLPVHHLDAIHHGPGWQPRPKPDFLADMAAIVATPEWIIDGNYTSAIRDRLARADLIILLDLSRRIRVPRLLRRIAREFGTVRPDSAPGCPEQIDLAFLRYAWTWPRLVRPRVLAAIETAVDRTIHLTHPAEVTTLIDRLSPPVPASTP